MYHQSHHKKINNIKDKQIYRHLNPLERQFQSIFNRKTSFMINLTQYKKMKKC
jgi:hypothetical protein